MVIFSNRFLGVDGLHYSVAVKWWVRLNRQVWSRGQDVCISQGLVRHLCPNGLSKRLACASSQLISESHWTSLMVVDQAGTAKLLMILLPKLGDIIFTVVCLSK